MSRIPAREVLIASGAVSAVVSLCLLGAVATGMPAEAKAESATASSSSVLQPSSEVTGNRALMSGSHRGVWFELDADKPTLPKTFVEQAVLAAAAGSAAASDAEPVAPAQGASASVGAVHEQSRSSALAAVSGTPRDIAQVLAAEKGWTGSQWTCLDKLWNHESKYETTVRNSRSGAYGIPQALPASKMASAGADWRTNPVTQIVWGLGYIEARYGTPCGAWTYWVHHSSY